MLTRLLPCAQVATYTLDATGYDVAYTYTYDDNGNITGISHGTNTTSYVYDSANQLIRENNQALGFTHVWEYDNAGNILSRTEYAYTTGNLEGVTPTDTVTYTYGDSNWGDLLTAYDGNTITYDQIGNPLTDGTWTYTWEHGRQLASMTDGTTTWSHTYNVDGLRTQRTNGTTAYSYVYNGGSLRQLTRGSDTLYISYDASGAPMSLSYNGTPYYYATNLQGDITAILNTAGTAVVSYTYDAWGNILATEGTMKDTLGTLNPLRYRGYVYDQETGLYYLQSRYYNPEIGRFVNADGFVTTGQGFIGNNMFAYCGSNPIINVDTQGTRYCEATTIRGESIYNRFVSCGWQRKVTLAKGNPTPIGETDQGYVYLVEDASMVKVTFPGDVVVIDYRSHPNDDDSRVQIRNSVLIKDRQIQNQILTLLNQYELSNPSKWERNTDIDDMLIEWDAHNDVFAFWANERCQHVDIDNKDKGVSYFSYWWRAVYETIF